MQNHNGDDFRVEHLDFPRSKDSPRPQEHVSLNKAAQGLVIVFENQSEKAYEVEKSNLPIGLEILDSGSL